MYKTYIGMMEKSDYSGFATITNIRDEIIEQCAKLTKKQIRRVKDKECSTRNSILFMNILNETKTIVLQSVNLMKSQRNMILTVKKLTDEETKKKN